MENGSELYSGAYLMELAAAATEARFDLLATPVGQPRLILGELDLGQAVTSEALLRRGYVWNDRPSSRGRIHSLLRDYDSFQFVWNFPHRRPLMERGVDEDGDHGYDLSVQLRAAMKITEAGVVLQPELWTPTGPGCGDPKEDRDLYVILAEAHEETCHKLAAGLALAGELTVTWRQLNLPRLRRLEDVFREFSGLDAELIRRVWNSSILYPNPTESISFPEDMCLWVAPTAVSGICRNWRRQLEERM